MASLDVETAALERLVAALHAFGAEWQDAVRQADYGAQAAQHWIDDQVKLWEARVQLAKEMVAQAGGALSSCQAQAYTDSEGRSYVPDCSAQEAALARAQEHLQTMQENLKTTQGVHQQLTAAIASFQRRLNRSDSGMQRDLPAAENALDRRIRSIGHYQALNAPTSTIAPPGTGLPTRRGFTGGPLPGSGSPPPSPGGSPPGPGPNWPASSSPNSPIPGPGSPPPGPGGPPPVTVGPLPGSSRTPSPGPGSSLSDPGWTPPPNPSSPSLSSSSPPLNPNSSPSSSNSPTPVSGSPSPDSSSHPTGWNPKLDGTTRPEGDYEGKPSQEHGG